MSPVRNVQIFASQQPSSPEERRLAAGIYSVLRNSVAPVAVVNVYETSVIPVGMLAGPANIGRCDDDYSLGTGDTYPTKIPVMTYQQRLVPAAPRRTYG